MFPSALVQGFFLTLQKVQRWACQSAFWYCNKIPETMNLKEENFILAHGFSPWSFGSAVSGPVVRHSIMEECILG
jgi:hypothetical protein